MYGLIDAAMRRRVAENAGPAAWSSIAASAETGQTFAALHHYDDSVTHAPVTHDAAASDGTDHEVFHALMTVCGSP